MTPDPTPPPKSYPPPVPVRVVRQGVNVPLRQAGALGGAVLLLAALPAGFATPSVPLGLPMAAVGAVLLSRNAVWARRWLDGQVTRHPRLEQAIPGWLAPWALGRAKRAVESRRLV